jgi:hypothetical protein
MNFNDTCRAHEYFAVFYVLIPLAAPGLGGGAGFEVPRARIPAGIGFAGMLRRLRRKARLIIIIEAAGVVSSAAATHGFSAPAPHVRVFV